MPGGPGAPFLVMFGAGHSKSLETSEKSFFAIQGEIDILKLSSTFSSNRMNSENSGTNIGSSTGSLPFLSNMGGMFASAGLTNVGDTQVGGGVAPSLAEEGYNQDLSSLDVSGLQLDFLGIRRSLK